MPSEEVFVAALRKFRNNYLKKMPESRSKFDKKRQKFLPMAMNHMENNLHWSKKFGAYGFNCSWKDFLEKHELTVSS